jgi:hypothetical protein
MSPQLCTELHPLSVHQRRERLEVASVGVERQQAPVRVADQDPAVGEHLEAKRPAAGLTDLVDAPAFRVHPEDRSILRAGVDHAARVYEHVFCATSGDRDHPEWRHGDTLVAPA